MYDMDRRDFVRVGGTALATALAGCNAPSGGDDGTEAGGTTAGGGTTAAGGTTATGGTESDAPPGADVLGAEGDLQSSAAVSAVTLDEDRGAGQFVFTPAVVWIEPGATVEWTLESGSHSVTAYHPDNGDVPGRIPAGAAAFDSGNLGSGETFGHTFDTEGVYNYFCRPHRSLGMVGVVVVGGPAGGPGTTDPSDVGGTPGQRLGRQLEAAGVLGAEGGDGDDETASYDWLAATSDTYWYSLYNMSTNIAMSGNGVTFPNPDDDEQVRTFRERVQGITAAADVDRPPVANPNLNMAPFTTGDPSFTQQPVLSGEDGRPDASTLQWNPENSSRTVSPSALFWTHLKGITWAKNFENHLDVLPTQSIAPKFRAQVLTTMAQLGTKFALVDGRLRLNDRNLAMGSAWQPGAGLTDDRPRPRDHSAALWFLSDMVSVAEGGWFGYENPRPLIPAENVQALADGMARTTFGAFDPDTLFSATNARDAGELLGGVGWYGTHAGSADLEAAAADYADGVAANLGVDANGRVEGGAENQAATQGVVGQGLLWASEIDGVDHTDTAASVLGYLTDELYEDDPGVFASGTDDDVYRYTPRDAGDVLGGLNAADVVLGRDEVRPQLAAFFDQTMNRGRLQRSERPPSRSESAEHTLPLPPAAGGEFGQAAVSNAAVEYDAQTDEWTVVDDTFDCEGALYLANQEVWVSRWGEAFFQGRGVPGQSDEPR